ncbi:hypothetical protein ACHAWF_001852 [Thalassiosira exigua]
MGKKSRKVKVSKEGSSASTSGGKSADKGVRMPVGSTTTPNGNITNSISGGKHYQLPVEPGRMALIHGLVGRKELNEMRVEIKKILGSGCIAVQVIHYLGSDFEKAEVVSIKRENLVVLGDTPKINGSLAGTELKHLGMAVEECPICMDTMMDTEDNAVFMDCCGGSFCKNCAIKSFSEQMISERMKSCPLCRADKSDDSGEASVVRIRARAERGDASAMFDLGGIYDGGLRGVQQDQSLARTWYQKAAEKGDTRGAYNLACSYNDGDGGLVDLALAAEYFRMSAEKGHIQAATNLGIAYMCGNGVERDIDEARKWFSVGAQVGDEVAEQNLDLLDMMSTMSGLSFDSTLGANVLSFGR